MHTRRLLAVLGLALIVSAGAGRAQADEGRYSKSDWPLRVIERPLTLAGGMVELRGDTLRVNLTRDSEGKPISLAPDVFFGATRDLSIGVTHDVGVCVTGKSKGCPYAYDDVGLEALYALMHGGNFQLAARGGVLVPHIHDDLTAGVDVGLIARLTAGKFAVRLDPQIYIGALGRDPDVPVLGGPARPIGPKETLDFPGQLQLQLNEQSEVYVSGGVIGPLDGFGDSFLIPVGFGATFAINNRLDLGGELRFFNLAGKRSDTDQRELIARVALRL